MTPAQRIAVLNKPASLHDGISYNALTGVAYAKVPGGALTKGGLTDVFTFTGGNQSYYMGPAGVLVPSVTNTPRIEYDVNGNLLGLLLENTGTNLALHSNDWTNAAWVKTTMTTAKTATGPDGVSNSATTLTAAGANSLAVQTVVSASAARAFGVWIKRRTGTGNVDLVVDGITYTTKAITAAWALYQIAQAAVTNPIFGIRLVTDTDAVDVWCGQLESATFASSSIPTTTVAVARAADICRRTLGAEFTATAPGTTIVSARASAGQLVSGNQYIWIFSDGTFNENFRLVRPANSDLARYGFTDGGVGQGFLDGTMTNSTPFKAAVCWATNDFAYSFNGAAVTTDTAGTLPTCTTCSLGMAGDSTTEQMNGHIRSFDYYPTRRSNAFLQQAST